MTCKHGTTGVVCSYCDAETVERYESRKRPSAHEALSKMVEWCDRNDWGSVPAKLEALCRNALLSETERSERDAVIEEVAKHIEASPLTYFGPDPGGVRDLRYLIVAAIRDMKGRP